MENESYYFESVVFTLQETGAKIELSSVESDRSVDKELKAA